MNFESHSKVFGKVNSGLEITSGILVTPKLGVASILCLHIYYMKPTLSTEGFHIIKFKHKMDATPSFGVTMTSEVLSKSQLTLE